MTKRIKTAALTDKQKDAFIEGWENAGGYIDDLDTPYPWCCPWFYASEILVDGETPEQWGADWWNQCKEEIDELTDEEAAC